MMMTTTAISDDDLVEINDGADGEDDNDDDDNAD